MRIPIEINEDRDRRLANQRLFRSHYVRCSCGQGCSVCAYTGLVTKGLRTAGGPDEDEAPDARPA